MKKTIIFKTAVLMAFFHVQVSYAQTSTPACLPMKKGENVKQTIENAGLEEAEVFNRLVFAEGISTEAHYDPVCKEQLDALYEAIAWGVMNRVRMSEASSALRRKFGQGVNGVIFKANQFKPSTSKKSKFTKVFLCPQRFEGWKNFWDRASRVTRKVRTFLEKIHLFKLTGRRVIKFH